MLRAHSLLQRHIQGAGSPHAHRRWGSRAKGRSACHVRCGLFDLRLRTVVCVRFDQPHRGRRVEQAETRGSEQASERWQGIESRHLPALPLVYLSLGLSVLDHRAELVLHAISPRRACDDALLPLPLLLMSTPSSPIPVCLRACLCACLCYYHTHKHTCACTSRSDKK